MNYKNIQTVEDAASAIGVPLLTEEEHGNLLCLPKSMARNNYLHYLLTIVCRAINGEWEPDWYSEEYVGQIMYYMPGRQGLAPISSRCGLGYLRNSCGPVGTAESCGMSLSLKDYDLCRYVIRQFGDLWIEYLTGIK